MYGLPTFSLRDPLNDNIRQQTCSVDPSAPWSGKDVKPSRLAVVRYSLLPEYPSQSLTPHLSVLLGATNPMASAPGTIRGDYAIVCPPFPSIPTLPSSFTNSPLPCTPERLTLDTNRTSAAMSATAPTASTTPRRKSTSGSPKTRCCRTKPRLSTGSSRSPRSILRWYIW